MTKKTKTQLGAIFILAVLVLSLILSQTASPDSQLFWGLKRIQEKVYLKLKSNPNEKLDYMRFLLDRRLQELKSQVERQSYGYILPSALRYSTLAGQITDIIIVNNMKDQVASIINQFKDHQKALYEIYVIYPKNTDNLEYKYIEDDINYLKLYLDKLTKIQ
ncbi:hypothetical protein HYW41_03270 [Candidatus Daviesbacteria bacterium]|nr:hypothetical protein [Candidatus Daviesbacteria bacterium]